MRKGFAATERITEEMESDMQDYYDKIGFPDKNYAELTLEYVEGELHVEFDLRRPTDKDDDISLENWNTLYPFIGNARTFYDAYLKERLDKDQAFFRHAGPLLADTLLKLLSFYAIRPGHAAVKLPIDATLLSGFRNKDKLNVSLRMDGEFADQIKRQAIDYIEIRIEASDYRLQKIKDMMDDAMSVTIHSGSMRYRTDHSDEFLFKNENIKNDISVGDNVRIYTPLNSHELRNPRKEDVEACNNLLHHLNENLEFYHRVIWLNMDKQRRFMLLDGIMAPGKANGRSVASVVENRLIGIAGNCLIMPVSPGIQLDPTLDKDIDLSQHYYTEPLDPIRLSLPSKGVFAEAVMGKCNSCEKKDETRFWRWEESPIPDSPTTINPISTPVPQNVQPTLQAKDFASPIINLQNAPSIPDPQGYGALTQLLANSNLFRDMAGLAANQSNAMGAMNSSLAAAQNFAGMAKDLETQKQNQANSDQIVDAINNSGLSKDEKDQLMKDHLQQLINGGAAKKDDTQTSGDEPTALGLAAEAEKKNKPVKASTTDASGKTQSVEVGSGEKDDPVIVEVEGAIPVDIKQDKKNTCWATAATIMMSWKKKTRMAVADVLKIADNGGNKYLDMFNNGEDGQLLTTADKAAFIQGLGMVADTTETTSTLQYFINLVMTYGPIWLTTDSDAEAGQFSPHAYILKQIKGTRSADGKGASFVLLNPASGKQETEMFNDFMVKFKSMITDNPSPNPFIRIVHFKDEYIGEGRDSSVEAQRWVDLENLPINTWESAIVDLVKAKSTQDWFTNDYRTTNDPRGPLSSRPGFVVGLAIMYGRLYRRLGIEEKFAVAMSAPPIDPAVIVTLHGKQYNVDALDKLSGDFTRLGITDSGGKINLRKVFTALIGLGMQESSGDFSDGLNLDNSDWQKGRDSLGITDPADKSERVKAKAEALKPAKDTEAGMFQVSYSVGVNPVGDVDRFRYLRDIYALYQVLPPWGSLLDFFKIGQHKTPNPQPHLATALNEHENNDGYKLQDLIFKNLAFSTELSALAIRKNAAHYGTIRDTNGITIKKEVYDMFEAVEAIVDDAAFGVVRAKWEGQWRTNADFSIIDSAAIEGTLWLLVKDESRDYVVVAKLSNKQINILTTTASEGNEAKKICATDEKTVWIIDGDNKIWKWKTDKYVQVTDELANDIAADSDGNLWIVGTKDEDSDGWTIRQLRDPDNNSIWISADKKGKKIYLDQNNVVWVIDKWGKLFYYTAVDGWQEQTLPIRDTMGTDPVTDVAVGIVNGQREVWILGSIDTVGNNFTLYKLHTGMNEWLSYDGAGVAIAVDKKDNRPYYINDKGEVYKMIMP